MTKEPTRRKYTTVTIPTPLRERIVGLIKDSGFKSVSDYTTYILREIVATHESEKLSTHFNKEDVEHIRKRLKLLGYM